MFRGAASRAVAWRNGWWVLFDVMELGAELTRLRARLYVVEREVTIMLGKFRVAIAVVMPQSRTPFIADAVTAVGALPRSYVVTYRASDMSPVLRQPDDGRRYDYNGVISKWKREGKQVHEFQCIEDVLKVADRLPIEFAQIFPKLIGESAEYCGMVLDESIRHYRFEGVPLLNGDVNIVQEYCFNLLYEASGAADVRRTLTHG